jgi:hypothetical protein
LNICLTANRYLKLAHNFDGFCSFPASAERRVILDLETLRPHGKLSFIL